MAWGGLLGCPGLARGRALTTGVGGGGFGSTLWVLGCFGASNAKGDCESGRDDRDEPDDMEAKYDAGSTMGIVGERSGQRGSAQRHCDGGDGDG